MAEDIDLKMRGMMGQSMVMPPEPVALQVPPPPAPSLQPGWQQDFQSQMPMQAQPSVPAQEPVPAQAPAAAQQQPVNLDGSPNVLYQPPAPVVDPVADLTQQLSVAQEQAKPAGFGEKLATGLLSLPGIRQTVGRVAEPFLPNREEAQKRVENLTTQLQQRGEAESGLAFLKDFSPGLYAAALRMEGPKQAAFVKNALERIDQGQRIKRFSFDQEQAKLDDAWRWGSLRERLAAQGIVRQQMADAREERQYLADEKAVRETQQRAMATARTTPVISRLLIAKVGADDVHSLLMSSTQGGEGKIILSLPSVEEVMASLQRTLSMGGQSSVEMMKAITPTSLHGKKAKMLEWLDGHPREHLTEDQFKNLMEISLRQQGILRDKVKKLYSNAGLTLKGIFDRDARRSKDGQSYLKQIYDAGLDEVALDIVSKQKKFVRRQKNKQTGELRNVFDDGSFEVIRD